MSKRVNLSKKQKINLLNDFKDNSLKRKQLSIKYKVDVSTVSKIIKSEEKIRDLALSTNLKSKRQRKGEHPNVEKALAIWFNDMRSQNAVITSLMIMNKAKEFAIQLDEVFEPDSSWLFRWRKRSYIKFGKIHGESNENDNLAAADFQSLLPGILKEYSPDCIF
ncbi:tigger transposable element-derived protein 3-like [Lucilia cuprina]|uniref:tigger transposable element-derived protein 3-like n=1 Tax=Lucilia cuprina TaxID=7375 RepID=UPI001F06EC38|nr:tigger transposable element-derived protein 3-like [Lucilia cuprina]